MAAKLEGKAIGVSKHTTQIKFWKEKYYDIFAGKLLKHIYFKFPFKDDMSFHSYHWIQYELGTRTNLKFIFG